MRVPDEKGAAGCGGFSVGGIKYIASGYVTDGMSAICGARESVRSVIDESVRCMEEGVRMRGCLMVSANDIEGIEKSYKVWSWSGCGWASCSEVGGVFGGSSWDGMSEAGESRWILLEESYMEPVFYGQITRMSYLLTGSWWHMSGGCTGIRLLAITSVTVS